MRTSFLAEILDWITTFLKSCLLFCLATSLLAQQYHNDVSSLALSRLSSFLLDQPVISTRIRYYCLLFEYLSHSSCPYLILSSCCMSASKISLISFFSPVFCFTVPLLVQKYQNVVHPKFPFFSVIPAPYHYQNIRIPLHRFVLFPFQCHLFHFSFLSSSSLVVTPCPSSISVPPIPGKWDVQAISSPCEIFLRWPFHFRMT